MPRHACARRCWCSIRRPTTLVGIDNASHIFTAAKHPKSFVSLAGADHLLSKKGDAVYVANVIAAWAERYLDRPEVMTEAEVEAGLVLVRETHGGKFQQEILTGPHRLLADEPVKLGGLDIRARALRFPAGRARRLHLDDDPALCRLQENAAGERVGAAQPRKKIHGKDCEDCETKVSMVDHIERAITLEGPLDAEQRKRLMEIADKCPVHQTLESKIDIHTVERAA